MDRLAMFTEPIFLVGDSNIRLDCPSDPHACTLVDDVASYGCANRVPSATHDHGGMLDVFVTRNDLSAPSVEVIDDDLSDHRLLCWQAPLVRPRPSYSTVTSRPWNRLDPAEFRAELLHLPLFRPDAWSCLNIDAMAQVYDDELTTILDWLIPIRTLRFRRRVSDPWFDDDCRVAKRCVRFFEREARRVRRNDPDNIAGQTAATEAFYTRRREYRRLTQEKRNAFWRM